MNAQIERDMLNDRYVRGKSISEIAKTYDVDQEAAEDVVGQPWQLTRKARSSTSSEGLFRGSVNPYKA